MPEFRLPVDHYTTGDFLKFGDKIRRRLILWAKHLGDDVDVPAGTTVYAVGRGKVVLSQMRLGTKEKRDWGGVVIVQHQNFFSVSGHMENLQVNVGEQVEVGDILGVVAPGGSAANGMWREAHLHFGIYTGPWKHEILPGYYRPDAWLTRKPVTKFSYWHNPQEFIAQQNKGLPPVN